MQETKSIATEERIDSPRSMNSLVNKFESHNVAQGSIEETLLLNSPETKERLEDIFLSRASFFNCLPGNMLPPSYQGVEIDLSSQTWDYFLASKTDPLHSALDVKIESFEDLLQASSSAPQISSKPSPGKTRIDSYGFIHTNENPDKDFSFLDDSVRISMRTEKWNQILQQWSTLSADKIRKINSNIIKGVPNQIRGELWKRLTNIAQIHTYSLKAFSKLASDPSVSIPQMKNDIATLYPNHVFYQPSALGQTYLLNTLTAFAAFRDSVGYSKQLAKIAAILLLYMTQEEAFSVLQQITSSSYKLTEMFEPGFPMLYKCLFTHEHLLQQYLPRLAGHFKSIGIDSSMYSFPWYKSLFLDVLSFPYAVRVMDLFFADGMKTLFRISLAILKLLQRSLLSANLETAVLILNNVQTNLQVTPDDLINAMAEFPLATKRLEKLIREYDGRANASLNK